MDKNVLSMVPVSMSANLIKDDGVVEFSMCKPGTFQDATNSTACKLCTAGEGIPPPGAAARGWYLNGCRTCAAAQDHIVHEGRALVSRARQGRTAT